MGTNEGFSGVSNCYVFKSRLQEYAQKVGLPTPVYETIKEGPSHEPSFRSTVIVHNVRYDSLPGFFNRKAAEQSAAEVALLELVKSGEVNERISQPVQETGLCKNLLQEYAQKMNYAMPVYQCEKDEAPGRVTYFSCTVDIGGISYKGALARTKKEAEIKAARIALLAIQSSASESSANSTCNSQLTVIPFKKRPAETASHDPDEAANVPKTKKARFKRKLLKKKQSGAGTDDFLDKSTCNLTIYAEDQAKEEADKTDMTEVQGLCSELSAAETLGNCQKENLEADPSGRELSVTKDAKAPDNSIDTQLTAAYHGDCEASDRGNSPMGYGDIPTLVKVTGVSEVNASLSQMETSRSYLAYANQ